MQKFYKKVVKNRGYDGLDKDEMKGEREEGKEKRRTVCLKKSNLIRPLSQNNTPRHNKPLSPEQKQKKPARRG